MHAVLRGEFEKLVPKPGERVGIKRLPDSTRGAQNYKRFAVLVDREGADAVPVFRGQVADMPDEEYKRISEEHPPDWNEQPQQPDVGEFSSKSLAGEDDLPF
jgi:hypothetical protein